MYHSPPSLDEVYCITELLFPSSSLGHSPRAVVGARVDPAVGGRGSKGNFPKSRRPKMVCSII